MFNRLSLSIRLWKRKLFKRPKRLYRKPKPSRMNTPTHKKLRQELGI